MALSGIEQFIVFGFMPLMIGLFAGGRSSPGVRSLTGRLVLPPCDPLPDTALVTIELVEQQRGQSLLPAVASETMSWQGAGIQAFALPIEPAAIDPMAFYALRAHVEDNGRTLFETAHSQLVAPLAGGKATLMLSPAG